MVTAAHLFSTLWLLAYILTTTTFSFSLKGFSVAPAAVAALVVFAGVAVTGPILLAFVIFAPFAVALHVVPAGITVGGAWSSALLGRAVFVAQARGALFVLQTGTIVWNVVATSLNGFAQDKGVRVTTSFDVVLPLPAHLS